MSDFPRPPEAAGNFSGFDTFKMTDSPCKIAVWYPQIPDFPNCWSSGWNQGGYLGKRYSVVLGLFSLFRQLRTEGNPFTHLDSNVDDKIKLIAGSRTDVEPPRLARASTTSNNPSWLPWESRAIGKRVYSCPSRRRRDRKIANLSFNVSSAWYYERLWRFIMRNACFSLNGLKNQNFLLNGFISETTPPPQGGFGPKSWNHKFFHPFKVYASS